MNKFVFDVDGTLTLSRRKIDAVFQRWFLEFCYDNNVYLVTGSDYPKTVEQVGTSIAENVKRVYNCNGNDVWEAGVNVRTNEWTLPKECFSWLEDKLEESSFNIRTGNHIEQRPGMVNFSIVGRNATQEERKAYVIYETDHNERRHISDLFNEHFPNLQATVGGETGIDISPRGANKAQILADFDQDDNILFFGDAMFEGGNDEPLANAIETRKNFNKSYPVTNWKYTREILLAYTTNRI